MEIDIIQRYITQRGGKHKDRTGLLQICYVATQPVYRVNDYECLCYKGLYNEFICILSSCRQDAAQLLYNELICILLTCRQDAAQL